MFWDAVGGVVRFFDSGSSPAAGAAGGGGKSEGGSMWAALLASMVQSSSGGQPGQQVMQPYSNSGAISVGGVGMPAGPIPTPPASPFALFNPFQSGGTPAPLDMGAPLTLGLLAIGVIGAIAIIKSKKGA